MYLHNFSLHPNISVIKAEAVSDCHLVGCFKILDCKPEKKSAAGEDQKRTPVLAAKQMGFTSGLEEVSKGKRDAVTR